MTTQDVLLAVGGMLAGVMVGLTGMGGAALVTPLLVIGFGIPAGVAVSSDVVVNAIVKPVGSAVHLHRRTPHLGLVLWLSIGSVPGVVLGTLLFSRVLHSDDATDQLTQAIAWTMVIALGAMVVRSVLARRGTQSPRPESEPGQHTPVRRLPTAALGAAVGLIVGMTSVGSGSLIVTSLLLFYPLLRPSVLVGTDLLQAVPMLAAGAMAHAFVGAVDWRVTVALLLGEVPGVLLGARLSSRYDGSALRGLLMVVLLATALRLLSVPTLWCAVVALTGVAVVAGRILAADHRGTVAARAVTPRIREE